jgi:hypothetical protein
VIIKGLKGSNDRVILDSSIKDYLISCKSSNSDPFKTFNRFFIYRFLKSNGVNYSPFYSSKNSVTSAFRHHSAADINQVSNSKEHSKLYLGHKNISSTNHYGKERKN